MIEKEKIDKILEDYGKEITIATICSHTAFQIFHGAKKEGFKTLGICKEENKFAYESFPLAQPDEFLTVGNYQEILEEPFQEKLRKKNSVVIPHGSFVEYVGAKNIEKNFLVPLFGNRSVLEWESDREKEREWLQEAGIKVPLQFEEPSQIDRVVMVKFPGAKGGENYFLASNEEEFYEKLEKFKGSKENYTIQEYIIGTRFYPHYFYSPLEKETELMSMDVRYESNIEGFSRIPSSLQSEIEPSFVVTGNTPVVARESLIPKILKMGQKVINSSQELFSPGLHGPFCIETICTDNLEFVAFEISARIVAGTNLYIKGSPYSHLIYEEPMSTGRRISREIKTALRKDTLTKIVY